jgi:GTP-binding protein HflX
MSSRMQPEPTGGAAERTALVALVSGGTLRRVVEEHLDELERLIDTAGGSVVVREIQERPAPDPATVIGSGFLERLADRCRDEQIDVVVFDEDLTASQVRNIERAAGQRRARAAVILDIFARGRAAGKPRPRSSWPSSTTCCRA